MKTVFALIASYPMFRGCVTIIGLHVVFVATLLTGCSIGDEGLPDAYAYTAGGIVIMILLLIAWKKFWDAMDNDLLGELRNDGMDVNPDEK